MLSEHNSTPETSLPLDLFSASCIVQGISFGLLDLMCAMYVFAPLCVGFLLRKSLKTPEIPGYLPLGHEDQVGGRLVPDLVTRGRVEDPRREVQELRRVRVQPVEKSTCSEPGEPPMCFVRYNTE